MVAVPVPTSTFNKDFIKKRHQHKCFSVNFVKFLEQLFYGKPPVAACEFRNIFPT